MATIEADAHSLVSAARHLIHIDDPQTDDLWQLSAPGLEDTSAKCQLLCLSHFLGDPDLAGRIHATWHGLSRSCHIQIYELAPTAAELEGWLETAWTLAEHVHRIRLRARA